MLPLIEENLTPLVRKEKNPEVLQALLSHVNGYVKKLERELNELREAKAKKEQQSLFLDEELLKFKKMLFGASSEKRKVSDRYREKQKRRISLHGQSLAPAPKEEEATKLTEIKVDYELSGEELSDIAEEYGYPRDSEWEHIKGFYDESTDIDVEVQSYKRRRHCRHKYRLKASKKEEKQIIVTAPGPVKLVPKANYSAKFAVEVVGSKYLYHLPLERIRRQMESSGLKIECKGLYSLCYFVFIHLEELSKRIREEILSKGLCLHLDETPWPINNSKQSNGYMWVLSHQGGSYYQFDPTRSGAVAKELLGSYMGPILTDAYAGYISQVKRLEKEEKIKRITLAFCWSHARRKFIEIEQNYPKICKEVLDLIGDLFALEHEVRSYEELVKIRTERSEPVIKKIRSCLLKYKLESRKGSGLEKAINYALKHWEGLTHFVKDERIPLTNNDAERAIRHSVMGRKNFYGSKTINGADVAATFYTIIESCKKVELDPKGYILMALEEKLAGRQAPTPLQYAKQIRS